MRAHYLQHVPFEGLGSMAQWFLTAGVDVSVTRFFESTDLPDPTLLDLLVVMGGPMSVNDHARYPWLAAEKTFIRHMIDAGKPVLGICLGAQLIASAMGGAGISQSGEGNRLVPGDRDPVRSRTRILHSSLGGCVSLAW